MPAECKPHARFKSLLPERTEEERNFLEEDLAVTGGCITPLETWRGYLADGYGRWAFCERQGWEVGSGRVPVRELPEDWTEDQVVIHLYKRHVGRRNLHPAMRDNLLAQIYASYQAEPQGEVRVGELGKTGNIARDVAKETGVSRSTVERAVSKVAKENLAEQLPEKIRHQHVTGKCPLSKGNMESLLKCEQLQQVERAVRVGQAPTTAVAYRQITGRQLIKEKKGDEIVPQDTEDTEVLKDSRGIPVPKPVRAAFESLVEFRAHIRMLQQELKGIQEFLDKPGTDYLRAESNTVLVDLKNVIGTLKGAQPYAVCPFCAGKGCKKQPAKTMIWCLGRGYLTKELKGLNDETWAKLDKMLEE